MSLKQNEFLEEVLTALKKPSEIRHPRDLETLESLLKRVDFFQQLMEEQQSSQIVKECCLHLEHFYATPNYTIYDADSIGDRFYIILIGEVGVYTKKDASDQQGVQMTKSQQLLSKVKERFRQTTAQNKFQDFQISKLQPRIGNKADLVLINVLQPGRSFGEMALVSNKPHLSSIVTLQACHFAMLKKQYFVSLMKLNQQQNLIKEMGTFAQLQLFDGFPVNNIRHIYQNSESLTCRMNQIIFKQNDIVKGCYFVKSGTFELSYQIPEEYDSFQAQSVSYYNMHDTTTIFQNQNMKTTTRKIATVGANYIIALESLSQPQNKHRFTCVCSSATGLLLKINAKLFENKILTNQSSSEYLTEYSKHQNEHWNGRINKIVQSMSAYKQYIYNPSQQDFKKNGGRLLQMKPQDESKVETINRVNVIGSKKYQIQAHRDLLSVKVRSTQKVRPRTILNDTVTKELNQSGIQNLTRRHYSNHFNQAMPSFSQDVSNPTTERNRSFTRIQSLHSQFNKPYQRNPGLLNQEQVQLVNSILSNRVQLPRPYSYDFRKHQNSQIDIGQPNNNQVINRTQKSKSQYIMIKQLNTKQ